MRVAINLLSLVLASGLGAQTLPSVQGLEGIEAQGTVTLTTPRTTLTGTITLDASGAGDCRVVLDFSSPGRTRRITAVASGKRAHIEGPAALLAAAPMPVGARLGCALLAPRVGGSGVALTADPATGRAATLVWKRRGRQIRLDYGYAASSPYPAQATERVDGAVRLQATFTSVQAHEFTAADFALPPPPAAAAARKGGAQ